MNDYIDNIYIFDNYRNFLKGYFDCVQKNNRKFTYRAFSRKVGISQNLISLILKGERNISPQMAELLGENINLKKRKKRYFHLMVKYNQAKKAEDADHYFSEMKKIKKITGEYTIKDEQFEYYDKWYYPVVKEFISWYPWNDDYAILAKAIVPTITTNEAKNAVEVLERIGLIKKGIDNKYRQTEQIISADNIPVHRKKLIRKEILELGTEATETFDKNERYTTFHTLSLDNEAYEEAIQIIQEAESKLSELAKNNTNNNQKVYEIIFNAFPVTKEFKEL